MSSTLEGVTLTPASAAQPPPKKQVSFDTLTPKQKESYLMVLKIRPFNEFIQIHKEHYLRLLEEKLRETPGVIPEDFKNKYLQILERMPVEQLSQLHKDAYLKILEETPFHYLSQLHRNNYRTLVSGSLTSTNMTPEQRARLNAFRRKMTTYERRTMLRKLNNQAAGINRNSVRVITEAAQEARAARAAAAAAPRTLLGSIFSSSRPPPSPLSRQPPATAAAARTATAAPAAARAATAAPAATPAATPAAAAAAAVELQRITTRISAAQEADNMPLVASLAREKKALEDALARATPVTEVSEANCFGCFGKKGGSKNRSNKARKAHKPHKTRKSHRSKRTRKYKR